MTRDLQQTLRLQTQNFVWKYGLCTRIFWQTFIPWLTRTHKSQSFKKQRRHYRSASSDVLSHVTGHHQVACCVMWPVIIKWRAVSRDLSSSSDVLCHVTSHQVTSCVTWLVIIKWRVVSRDQPSSRDVKCHVVLPLVGRLERICRISSASDTNKLS